jgi:hypothetical protein
MGIYSEWFLVLAVASFEVAHSYSFGTNEAHGHLHLESGHESSPRILRRLKNKSKKGCDGGTCSPTTEPTVMPTSEPTTKELLTAPSPSPTNNIWNVVQQGANGSFISTCQVTPEPTMISSTPFTTMINFEYYVFLAESIEPEEARAKISAFESTLHTAITKRAMPCKYQDVDTIVMLLSLAGEDSVVSRCLDGATEPVDSCWQVSAQMTAIIASTLSNSELLPLYHEWIKESLISTVDGTTVLDAAFQGFKNVDFGDGKELLDSDFSGSSGDFSALVHGNIPVEGAESQPIGPLVLAIATLVLVLLTIFLLQRRRRRQKSLTEYAQKIDDLEMDEPPPTEPKHQVTIVNDGDDLSRHESDFDDLQIVEKLDHEPRLCSVANCSTCRLKSATIFIPVKK